MNGWMNENINNELISKLINKYKSVNKLTN